MAIRRMTVTPNKWVCISEDAIGHRITSIGSVPVAVVFTPLPDPIEDTTRKAFYLGGTVDRITTRSGTWVWVKSADPEKDALIELDYSVNKEETAVDKVYKVSVFLQKELAKLINRTTKTELFCSEARTRLNQCTTTLFDHQGFIADLYGRVATNDTAMALLKLDFMERIKDLRFTLNSKLNDDLRAIEKRIMRDFNQTVNELVNSGLSEDMSGLPANTKINIYLSTMVEFASKTNMEDLNYSFAKITGANTFPASMYNVVNTLYLKQREKIWPTVGYEITKPVMPTIFPLAESTE